MPYIAATIAVLGFLAAMVLINYFGSAVAKARQHALSDADAQALMECRDLLAALDSAARHGLIARTEPEKEVEAASVALVIARGGTELGRLGHLITTLGRLADSGTED